LSNDLIILQNKWINIIGLFIIRLHINEHNSTRPTYWVYGLVSPVLFLVLGLFPIFLLCHHFEILVLGLSICSYISGYKCK